MKRQTALKLMKEIKSIQGKIPYDADYSNCEHNFRWFFVNTKEDWEAICTCFELENEQAESITTFPEWVCLEDDDCTLNFDEFYKCGEAWGIQINTLTSCKEAFQELLDSLN